MSLLEACELIGITVPRFCYHERLKVAGNCRMCLVEVENAPKPVASCAFPVSDDLRVFTNTPLVQKARENVLEFLLINHPLDCPICDQGGECDLQEQVLMFGSDRSRFRFSKRAVSDKNCGVIVKTIMTRCIHCTRCVRFYQDIVGEGSLGTALRGKSTEVTTYTRQILSSELSGNLVDLCPVGALTSKPYAFVARPWELKTKNAIDISDSLGSHVSVQYKDSSVLRIKPVLNDGLNEEWLSDKSRYFFDGLKLHRLMRPFHKVKNSFFQISWNQVLFIIHDKLRTSLQSKKNILIVCGNHLDFEATTALQNFSDSLDVTLITEDNYHVDTNVLLKTCFMVNFHQLLTSDLCLLVGTNPRLEASLLNIKLKRRKRKGLFLVSRVGLQEPLFFKCSGLGISPLSLLNILEGKNSFCKPFSKATRPFVLVGEALLKRNDGVSLQYALSRLKDRVKFLERGWFPINFLPLTLSFSCSAFLGISHKNNLNALSCLNLSYLAGLDSPDKILKELAPSCFSIVQSSYGNYFFKKTNLLVPSTAFIEKKSFFFNIEGKLEYFDKVLESFTLARRDKDILLAFILFLPKLKPINRKMETISSSKGGPLLFTRLLNPDSKVKVYKTVFKGRVFDFFLTNAITKNSDILSKCSLAYRKNFKNFT